MTDDFANWSARGRAPASDEAGLRRALADPEHRSDAALALVDAAAEGLAAETVAALGETVRTAPEAGARQFAVEALGVNGTGVEAIEAALTDDEEWVRAEAVVALSRAAAAPAERLRACLQTDESGWVRRNAVIALGKRGALDDEAAADRLTSDPHPAVREFAAQYLRNPGDTDRAVRLLAAVLAREENAFVRVKAAETLGHLGTDRAIEALETQGIGDRSDDVRRTAERALHRAKGIDAPGATGGGRSAPGTGPDRPGSRSTGPDPQPPNGVRTEPPSGRSGGERDARPTGAVHSPGQARDGPRPSSRRSGQPQPEGRPVGDRGPRGSGEEGDCPGPKATDKDRAGGDRQ